MFSQSWLQWQLVYYGWGAVLLCTSVVWGALTADTPAHHPAVGNDERAYIQNTALTVEVHLRSKLNINLYKRYVHNLP